MADITENSRVAIKVGTVVVAILALLSLGRWWGGIEAERTYTHDTLARHDQDIRDLRDTFGKMQMQLQDIQAKQAGQVESLNTAVRNTTFLVTEIDGLKVTLAEKGITVRGGG